MNGIDEVVNAVSIHLCGISSDIQNRNNVNQGVAL